MPTLPKTLLTVLSLFAIGITIQAQDSTRFDQAIALPNKIFNALDKKSRSVEEKLDKQASRYLTRLQKQENKLRKKVWKKDSALAKEIFDGANERYAVLKNSKGKLSRYSNVYSGHLDSLSTALSFLKDKGLTNNANLEKTLSNYSSLQQKLNASDQIKKYLVQRQEILREQFEKQGMVGELKKFRKEVYYYSAQVQEYKSLFEDPSKLEEKLMQLVMAVPQFKDFFASNSMLGSLFALPGSGSLLASPGGGGMLVGLQTRAMVNQNLVDRFGSSSAVTQALQQNVNAAQGQLNALKAKAESLKSGSYGNGNDADIPDFKPNMQKTKSFLQRLEYGANVQSQKSRYFLPVTSDIGLSLGYKLNDKSSLGIGASYKLGWGSGWRDIRLSHQGVGLRTYLDYRLKGSLYISGGYEQNYRSEFRNVAQLQDYSAWQKSGLVGLSKKYKVSKKLKGEMKLMWDFLSAQQVPKTQSIVFRVGYSFK